MNAKARTVMVMAAILIGWIAFGAPARAQDDLGREIKQRIAELSERARDALAEGREDEARELTNQANELRRELGLQVGERREGGEADFERKLDQARRRIAELREAGRIDEANALAEQVERSLREMRERREGAEARERERGEPRPELEARRRHLLEAAEHLDAAGMHDQAEMLRRQAGMRDVPREPGPPPFGPRGPGDVELREQVRRMAERLERLEGVIQMMIRERGDRPRGPEARERDPEPRREGDRAPEARRERDGDREREG